MFLRVLVVLDKGPLSSLCVCVCDNTAIDNTNKIGNDDDDVVQVHLSFSLYGADSVEDGVKSPQLQWNFLRLFLQSVGIVLTDIQDVTFKYVLLLSKVCEIA